VAAGDAPERGAGAVSGGGRPKKVSVALLSWNGREHLAACLPALAAQADPGVPWEVLVLDNGSADGTASWVRAHHPQVRLLESPVNLGFCAGVDRLMAAAEGDAVALLNNDTRPDRRWLAALVDALASAPADVAAVSGMIVDWAGERLDFARGVMTFDGHAFQAGFRRPLAAAGAGGPDPVPADGAELFFACGGNMLIRRASFVAAGGFDADYFAYLEDVDLGWRLWAGGERVLFARDAVVHHRSMATSELLGRFNRGFLFERNAFLTAYKNYQDGLWEKVMPALLLTLVSRTQTMLVQNNPGASTLTLDPYAGWIANTARAAAGESESAARVAVSSASPVPRSPGELLAALPAKWRELGPRELLRRAARRLGLRLRPHSRHLRHPRLTDDRTVAQLRVLTYLLAHLDGAAAKRRAVQARRVVPDREILARFPPYLVPTYPGDERLFASDGFRAWLPDDLPLVESTLEELMDVEE
jgi:GT2 family glycosyltransferase